MTDPSAEDEMRWALTLYVSGASPRSAAAIRTLEKICNGELDGRVDLTIVDVQGKPLPDLGNIVAIPTLVKNQPVPVRYLVGDLTDEPRLREGLDLGPAPVAEDTMTNHGPDSSVALDELQRQIHDLQKALEAISSGGVDAVVVGPPGEEQVYTLDSADRPYRVIVENMGEGSATISENGAVLFANARFGELMGQDRDSLLGKSLKRFFDEANGEILSELLSTAANETRRAELVIRSTDPGVPVLVSVTGLEIEGSLVRCLLLTDLSMQKRVDQQVAREAAREEQLTQNLRVAREVNDTIVQGLVAAEMALDLEDPSRARSLISSTSERARRWIGELVGEERLSGGMAVRSTPAARDGDGS